MKPLGARERTLIEKMKLRKICSRNWTEKDRWENGIEGEREERKWIGETGWGNRRGWWVYKIKKKTLGKEKEDEIA